MADTTFHSLTLPGQDTARVPSMAEEFTTETNYQVKDYCTYQGKLYRCITVHAAGAWNAAHFIETDIDTEFDRKLDIPISQASAPVNPRVGDLWIDNDENSPIYNIDASPILGSTNAVQSGGTKTALNSLDSRKMEHGIITGDFSASVDYRVGDLVFYATTANGITTRTLYRCTTNHNATTWNAAHFTATTLEVELQRVRDNEANMDMIGDLFGAKPTYAVGDYCIYNGNLYKCIREVNNSSTSDPAFDPDDWTQVALANDVSDLKSAITIGNFNQHIIFPLIKSTEEGGLRNNRASVEAITGGGAKLTRTSSDSQLSYGFYTVFGEKFVNKLGHKIYIKVAGLDKTHAPNFSQYRIMLSYNGATVNDSYKVFTNDTYTYIYTVTADFNQLTVLLTQSNQITLGEYFTVNYVQLIDLTEMFGEGYEPNIEEFETIYTEMPYARTISGNISSLSEVKTLNLMLKNEMEKDYEVVENNAGLLTSTKNYVLVLNNDSAYGDGGPCWFAPQDDTNQGGYVRNDGTRMFAIPDQGRLTDSNLPVNELFRIMKSYIGNDALVYGNDNTMFDSTTENHIDCSTFVSAVLQGIPYELSKHVQIKNTAIYDICSHWIGVAQGTIFGRIKTNIMANYFAEHKCLYTMPKKATEASKTLKLGDILFMRDGTESATHRYYGIGHVVIVLAVFPSRIIVAQCGGVVNELLDKNFNSTVGKVSSIFLTDQLIADYIPVFARPTYVQSREDNDKAVVDFIGGGDYIFDTSIMIPGMYINENNFGYIEASQNNAVSLKVFRVMPGSTLAFVGEVPTGIDTYDYRVAQYNENMVFISLNSIKSAPLVLTSNTRFVRFVTYFPGNINFHYADTLRVKIVNQT